MSWCTAAEVAELISVARLRSDVDAAARKAADLRFIDICTTAINAGDALLRIAAEATKPPGLRLNAVFAAQPLLTKEGWTEGGQFSDRSAVTQLLLRLTAEPSFNTDTKINVELLRSLAQIVSLEFPTEEWQAWIQACTYAFASTGDLTAAAKLRAVVSESYCNYALWSFLANDVAAFLLQAQLSMLPQRTLVLQTFLEMQRKRPRPSAEHEVASTSNCVVLSTAMRHFVMEALAVRVQEARVAGVTAAGFVEDCTAAFAVASRLVADADSAAHVFRCSSFFLSRMQDSAARGEMNESWTAFAGQLLECQLSTLQLFPAVARGDVEAGTLLTCLIHFMIPGEAEERADAAQLSAELLEFFMDDEAVPLGCGSGDTAHLAGAVLELYLEHDATQRTAAVATLNTILRSTPNLRGALADAVALALRSISRVYEAADAAVVDALDAATQAELLTQVSQLLLRTVDPHARTMLLDALTHCFYRSCNAALCRQLVQLLEQLHTAAAANTTSPDGCATCVQCACIYEASRLTEELRAQPWCGSLLRPAWTALAVGQLAAGDDTLSAFSAASLLCTLLYVSPDCMAYLCANRAAWEQGLMQLCRHATVRGVAILLTLALKHIAGVATGTTAHECTLVVASFDTAMAFCRHPSPSRHLVLRAVVDFIAAHTRALLRGGGCSVCAQGLSERTAPLLTADFSEELLQDEPSCRGFATSVTFQCIAFGATRPAMPTAVCAALLRALHHAVQQSYSSQTISCVCGHLTLVLVLQPALLDEVPAHVLHTLFAVRVDLVDGRKGVNYSGVAFFLSLFFLRVPHAVLHAAATVATTVSTSAAATPDRRDEFPFLVERAFGWWLSVAPFMDAVQFPYFAAACCRIIDVLVTAPAEVGGTSVTTLACTRHYLLPSLHVKRLPARPFTNLSVLQHLSLAWVDLERRYGSTSKPQVLDKELQPCVIGVAEHYTSLCGAAFAGSSSAALLRTTSAETITAVIGYLNQLDGGVATGAARQLLSTLTR